MNGIRERIQQFLTTEEGKFITIGIIVTVFSQIVLFVLVEYFGYDKSITNKQTQFIALEVSFVLNRYITWAAKRNSFVWDWCLFHLVRVFLVLFNIKVFDVLVQINVPYMLINFGLIGVEAAGNYLISKYIVYRKKPK